MQEDAASPATPSAAGGTSIRDFSGTANEYDTLMLESSDGARCKINKVQLSFLSPVFAHMFAECQQDNEPLRLAEDTLTLDLLFRVMLQMPVESPSQSVVTSALRAADKYEMNLVRVWLEHYTMYVWVTTAKQG